MAQAGLCLCDGELRAAASEERMLGVRVGRIRGIPIEVGYSFFLLLFFAYYYGATRGVGPLMALLFLVLCLAVLVHELAHGLVARWLGVPVVHIDLCFFGGAAKLARMPDAPRQEAIIALAGPGASLLLALLSEVGYQISGAHSLNYVTAMNLWLGLFNLAPVLPLDGGRVLRAALTSRLGPRRATRAAVRLSEVVALGAGLWVVASGEWLLLVFVALLWLSARRELRVFERWSRVAPRALGWDDQTPTEMAVLDHRGVPAGRRPTTLGSTFVIEEHRCASDTRWVVRGEDGEVLLVTDTSLR